MSLASARSRRLRSPTALGAALAVCAIGGALMLTPLAGCSRDADAAAIAGAAAALPSTDDPSFDPTKSLAPMLEAVGPAVVSVYAAGVRPDGTDASGPRGQGTGSGFVIEASGLVVTNDHVIDGASGIEVRLPDGRRFEAEVVGRDPATDLALLRLSGAEDLPTVSVGKSGELRVGDWVVAVGNPMGLQHSATVGIVSGKGRGSLGLYADSFIDFLQTDADIAPGSSGGPLFDLKGRVVGINTAVGGVGGPGFAIPIDQARRVIKQLERDGKVSRGWLGAASVEGDDPADGAKIGRVFEDTPAARAGLQPGDVVTAIDGEPIHGFAELRGLVATTEPGQRLRLTVSRGGETIDAEVELAARPEGGALASLREMPERPVAPPRAAPPEPPVRKGLDRFLSPLLGDTDTATPGTDGDARPRLGVGVRPVDDGLEVIDVTPGSLGDKLGLARGDRIIELGGSSVATADEVKAALGRSGREISVVFLRGGTRHESSYERS
jgi:serine protease Do